MKKILFAIFASLALISFTACEKDSGSSAEIYYYVSADSIQYTDNANASYDKRIRVALAKLEFVDYNFKEKAEVQSGNYAVYQCDEKADARFKSNNKKPISLSDISNTMFNEYRKYFEDTLNISTPSQISLKPFTIKLVLNSTWQKGYVVAYEKKTIQ